MAQLEVDTFEEEIIPQRLRCEGEFARETERQLYRNFVNQELFDDDMVTPDCYILYYENWFTLFGVEIKTHGASENGVFQEFENVIEDLEDDYGKLGETKFGVDMESTMKQKEVLEETFGDILPVVVKMDSLRSVPTQMVVQLMKMENMMFSMYDYPELFKEMMDRIANDTLAYFDFLEEQKLIMPTVDHVRLRQGSLCYTKDLPGYEEAKKRPFKTSDVWGFVDSQETVGISPDMFKEFIFPCYQKIASRYGLLSYGCCEPVDPIWDSCISKLANLRKVSISPWCNEEVMGEKLQGSKVIYLRKPSPNFLGVGTTLDEEGFRAAMRRTLRAARGCKLEIAQRDVYTINHDVAKARRYMDIIKEEIANHWQA